MKPPTTWKSFELIIARIFGGERRGADYADRDGGKNDVIHPHYSIECKLLGRPAWASMLAAAKQAEQSAGPLQQPIAIVKKKNARIMDSLVVMRLETFRDWHLNEDDTGEGPR